MTGPVLTITPSSAAQAYARVVSGDQAQGGAANDFSTMLGRALDGVMQSGHQADAQAVIAINGGGNLTDVATAVSHAELALQSAVAIRDKVVQAYQDVMRMPI